MRVTRFARQLIYGSGLLCGTFIFFSPLVLGGSPLFAQDMQTQERPVKTDSISPGLSDSQMHELEERTQSISDSVMSPYCPGRTLSACPSDQARLLRTKILDWLKSGLTDDAVHTKLKSSFGQEIEGAPRTRGFGLVGWVMPAIFLLMGIVAVLVALKVMAIRKQPERSKSITSENSDKKEKISSEIRDRLTGRM